MFTDFGWAPVGPVCDWRGAAGRYAGVSCWNMSFRASPCYEGQRPACVDGSLLSAICRSDGRSTGSLKISTSAQPPANRPTDVLAAATSVPLVFLERVETRQTRRRLQVEFLRFSRWHLNKAAAKMFPLQEIWSFWGFTTIQTLTRFFFLLNTQFVLSIRPKQST